MDLEKELTCSICTELLFQPLTLLDCLHTFCGACLKEWFAFQASAAEKSPLPLPPAGTPLFTCPACRAAVRDTKHNATVATLLEMFTTAHPERDRKAAEKEELRGKYQPGEKVLPEVDLSSRSGQEQIDAEEDRRLMEQVRQMSLNEVGVAPSANPSGPTRPQYRRRRTDEGNPETEHRSRRRPVSHDGRQRARRDGSVSSSGTHSAGNYLQPGNSRSSGHGSDGGRRRRSIDQRLGENTGVSSDIAVGNGGEASAVSARQVEHQSSLRSLIGTTGMSEDDIAREVEELARQIQEEGLLDGLDLDNLDPSHHDELSQRIAQAYQRRQREKEREKERERERERDRQRTTETRRARTDDQSDTSRPPRSASAQRYRSRDHSRTRRSTTTTPLVQNEPRRNSEDRSRPPLAPSAGHHLEIESDYRRRRAASTGNSSTGVVRSATDTISRPPPAETHAVRSQTDLATRTTIASDNRAAKSQTDLVPQSVAVTSRDARSQTDLTLRTANQPIIGTQGITMSPRDHGEGARFNPTTQIGDTGLSFASRLPQVTVAPAPQISSPSTSSMVQIPSSAVPRRGSSQRPTELPAELPSGSNQLAVGSGLASFRGSSHQRSISQPANFGASLAIRPASELKISCSRCNKPHIEYELHYNCGICASGTWNLCLLCYRKGRGCLHWFGFGYMAWRKWDRLRQAGDIGLEKPHMLTAGRYPHPNLSISMPHETIRESFESGCFCSRCHKRTNDCYWRCETCNDGDWGYCNTCVGLGRRCDHPLLPLTYQPVLSASGNSGESSGLPQWASLLTGPTAINIGSFRPLTFRPRCDVCVKPIQPIQNRMHCFQCVGESAGVHGNSYEGDYDVCMDCYALLISDGKISHQNGSAGWRRCLKGHRMVVETYIEGNGGERRVIVHDLVGGSMLKLEDHPGDRYLRWTTKENRKAVSRKVSRSVASDIPSSELEGAIFSVPRSRDLGMKATAGWSWFGQQEQAYDELYFPRGASLKEVELVGDSWYFGVFMDESGLFPAGYARVVSDA
ncbi:uncharacterized protein BROUX77_003123 [Berkeleyomyces rouxiae]|uniref:uncharacterized protein n=1 Tax=Berkeleyomyces rouxiae TaxID=2035830 RepID=UPI003B796B20